MHATVAAFTSFVPCISIAYSRKAWGMNEFMLGSTQWVIDANNLSCVTLIKMIRELLEERAEIETHLRNIIPIIIDQAFESGQEIKRLITRAS